MTKSFEQVNQTLIATLIGLIGMYFFRRLSNEIYIIIFGLLLGFTLIVGTLAVVQMFQNTIRYLRKD